MIPTGIPWVLQSDLELIAYEKQLMSLCELMRMCAVEKGLADLELEFHIPALKYLPPSQEPWTQVQVPLQRPSQDGADPVPVSFRPGDFDLYNVVGQRYLYIYIIYSYNILYIYHNIYVYMIFVYYHITISL